MKRKPEKSRFEIFASHTDLPTKGQTLLQRCEDASKKRDESRLARPDTWQDATVGKGQKKANTICN